MRFAIIGTSPIAGQFIDAGCSCPGFEAAAVYSRTADKARFFAQSHAIKESYTDLEALAACKHIDAVYIASPNACHFDQAMLMLEKGKHVLCEKPIATSAGQLEQMLCLAGEQNAVLLEASRHLFSPGTLALRALLEELGPLRRVSFVMNQYSSKYERFKAGDPANVFQAEMGGGALMDIGVYCVELMVFLFGMPKSIVSSSVMLPTGVDGQGAVIAGYDGFLAELSYSKISQSHVPSVIQGEEGSLLFEPLSNIRSIEIVKRDGRKRQVPCEAAENQMVYEIRAFMEMAKGKASPAPFNGYSKMAQEIMDTVKQQWNG